ncbi:MAG: hypothetical protein WCG01_05130 [bacterium]
MQTIKKLVASGVIFSTVLSMVVVAAPTKAASATAGDLIKMSGLSAVYYLGADSKRYVFPNEATYKSWYSDFSLVKTIPTDELQSYGIGGNVTIRPGTRLVKITTNPKVYAVEPGGSLVAITDEATAKKLYGDNWAKRVSDVPDAFFINYKETGKTVAAGQYPAGSLVKFSSSPDVYYINADGTASKIADEAAFKANRFEFSNVFDGSAVAMPALGAAVNGAVATDVTGGVNGGTYVGGSGVTVALAATTPASASVPQNGARVPMAKINLTAASDGAVTINSITVKRIGLSDYNKIPKVWAEKAGIIVAQKKSVSSNDEAILTFSPALTIAAGQTVTLDLLATLAAATGNIGLGIVSASAISTSGASVSGSFPVYGNIMAPIAYDVTNLTFATSTSAVNTVKVGDEKVELGRFDIGFQGTQKDVTLTSVMFKNNGVEDLTKTSMNLFLESNGTKVTDRYTVDGRYVTFYFTGAGLDILKNDVSSKQFIMKGDVIGKENVSTNSYEFTLNKSTDFAAYEKSTGFGVNVYTTLGAAGTVADGIALPMDTITAGAIAVTKKAVSPSDTTIIKGSDNVVLLANLRADESISADGLKIWYGSSVSTSSSVEQFENVRVYVNGVLVDSFDPAVTVPASALQFRSIDSSFTLAKGDNEVKVMAKARTNANPNSAFFAKLDGTNIFALKNPQYVSSTNAVTGEISGTASGAIFTVQGAVLQTVRNDGYSNGKRIVKGSTDVSLGKFTVKATNDAVNVTSISLGINTGSTSASNIYDAKLYVDGVQKGNTIDFGSSGASFQSLNFGIAKDKSVSVEVKASFDSSANGTFQSTLTVNANDSRGTSLVNVAPVVLTAQTVLFDVLTAGQLNVAIGGSNPTDAILAAGGSTAKSIAEYKLTAIDDTAVLTEVNFVNSSSSAAVATTSVADSIVSAIALYDGATLLDSTTLVNGSGKFIIPNGGLSIAANAYKNLTVKVLLNSISNDAGATNKDIRFALTYYKFKSSDGTLNTSANVDKIANNFRVRKTVPTVALQTLPTTLLTAGEQIVSKFTVAADATGDVTFATVTLKYATSTGSSLSVSGLTTVKIDGATKLATYSQDVANKTITVAFASPEVISAGASKTFEISATLVAGVAGDSVTTKIVEDADYVTDGTGNFVWSDGSSISTDTWSNGRRVPGLSTATQVLQK